MDHLGTVSSEGGPFLLADAWAVRSWGGVDSGDYKQLCEDFAAAGPEWGIQVSLDDHDAVAWEPEGACSADLYQTSASSFVLIRVYTSELGQTDRVREAGLHAPVDDFDDIGRVEIMSGILAIVWAPESRAGICGEDLVAADPRPSGALAADGSSLLVRLAPGRYRCLADFVDVEGGQVVRCRIIPEPTH